MSGPDKLDCGEPFLFNLFNEPAIISIPSIFRYPLAKLISKRRAPIAKNIYREIGNKSPILELTQDQAKSLENNLSKEGDYKCFVVMRCWHPRALEIVKEVRKYNPEEIILLPLYPQYSASTSGSSIKEWNDLCKKENYKVKTKTICCYPTENNFLESHANLIKKTIKNLDNKDFKLLFSAHGLPEIKIKKGDPYQWQVKRTAAAITEAIGRSDLDWITCYQSRVGPLEWIQPYTSDVLKRAGKEKKPVIVVPIGFTSEHSETLVELDIEYREIANLAGVPRYTRIDTVGDTSEFIEGLAKLVRMSISQNAELSSDGGRCQCPSLYGACAFRVA